MVFNKKTLILSALAVGLETASVSAWSPPAVPSSSAATRPITADATLSETRRSLFVTAGALLTASVAAKAGADTGAEVRGTELTPFNGLAFQYRGSEFGGLTAADVDEPSVPYAEFMEKMKAGGVESVEFLAPDGDVAYAIFKSGNGKQIRIGEGYPVEQHDGWSSPAFAVRAVKNAGVPYKFTVPALRAYNNNNN